jgi:hypothetical protein
VACLIVPAASLAFVADFGGAAGPDEVTRASYREAVEPICKANMEANERILAGVRAEVRRDELLPAARRFKRAAKVLKRTLHELMAVPRPAIDRPRLLRWFGFIAAEARLVEKTAAYLAAGKKIPAEGMVVRLEGPGSAPTTS